MRNRTALLAAASAMFLVAGGGTALAAAASSGPVYGGVVYGCYTNAEVGGSHAIVLQDAGTTCPKGTSSVSWNQTGPPGTNGTNGTNGASVLTSSGAPTGSCTTGDTDVDLANGEVYSCNSSAVWADTNASIEGPQGPAGTGATVTSLPAGSSGCANGGAQITDGNGDSAYACTGPAGPPGTSGASGPSSLDGLIGTPCDTSGGSNAGTLEVTYTPQANGTDSISLVCTQTNPDFALTVSLSSPSQEECDSYYVPLIGWECDFYYVYTTVTATSSDGVFNLTSDSSDGASQTAVYPSGTVVTLTTSGSWTNCPSGDSSDYGTVCAITVNSEMTLSAS